MLKSQLWSRILRAALQNVQMSSYEIFEKGDYKFLRTYVVFTKEAQRIRQFACERLEGFLAKERARPLRWENV